MLSIIKESISEFFQDDVLTLSAALAFYTALSLSPLLVVLVTIAGFLSNDTKQRLIQEIVAIVGEHAGAAVQGIVDSAQRTPITGSVAGLLSLLILLFSAAGVFGQLQSSLNTIWGVEATSGSGIKEWIRRRFVSIGMVLSFAFIMLASLIVSAVLSATLGAMALLESAVSFGVFVVLFALLFRFLPDVRIYWRDVWAGALLTALLFVFGKTGIAFYLGRSSVASAYGAAGSLVMLLLWFYYSSLIFFLGAELTQVWARSHGRAIRPNQHARFKGNHLQLAHST